MRCLWFVLLLCGVVSIDAFSCTGAIQGQCAVGGECYHCSAGTYAATPGSTCEQNTAGKCVACPVGSYCQVLNGVGVTTPTTCDTFHGNTLAAVCPGSTVCPGGFFCDTNHGQPPVTCPTGVPCEPNTAFAISFCDLANSAIPTGVGPGAMQAQCELCNAFQSDGVIENKGIWDKGTGARTRTCQGGTACRNTQCRYQPDQIGSGTTTGAVCHNCAVGTGVNVDPALTAYATNNLDYFCGGSSRPIGGFGACVDCPMGYYGPAIGSQCIECGPSTYQTGTKKTACINCPAGKASTSTGSTSDNCVECTAGTSSLEGGQCIDCPAHSYAENPNSATCTLCDAGTHYEGTQGSASAVCEDCPTDTFSVAGGPCISCPPGTSSPGGTGVCTSCLDNFWAPPPLNTTCVPCWPGSGRNITQGQTECVCEVGSAPFSAVITKVAGSDGGGFNNGVGSAVQFSGLSDTTTVPWTTDLFATDQHNQKIRRVSRSGTTTTFAGSGVQGTDDGQGGAAQFSVPSAIASSSSGDLFVADKSGHTIRKITPSAVVSTFLGSGGTSLAPGTGVGAQIGSPVGIVVNPTTHTLYFVSQGASLIMQATNPGAVMTFFFDNALHIGIANHLALLGSDLNHDVILATDINGLTFRRIPANGDPSTIVQNYAGGTTSCITVDPLTNDIIFSGRTTTNIHVFRLTLAGVATIIAGSGATPSVIVDGNALLASFPTPSSITAAGIPENTYFITSSNHVLRLGKACLDVDECATGGHTCGTGAAVACTNTMPGFKCECAPGYEGTGSSCTACTPGNYKSTLGDGNCTPCTVGTRPLVTPTWTAASAATVCLSCPEPTISGTFPVDVANAVEVPAGGTTCNYCGDVSIGCGLADAICTSAVGVGATCACAAGSHLVGGGLPGGVLQCNVTGVGETVNNCAAVNFPSFACSDTTGCQECNVAGTGVETYGDQCASINPLKCGECPAGTKSLNNRPGAGQPLTYQCVACPLHTYQDTVGQVTCTPCPVGFTTTTTRSTSVSQCIDPSVTTTAMAETTTAPMAETTTNPMPETTTAPMPETTTAPVPETETEAPMTTVPQPDSTPVPEVFHVWRNSSGVTLQNAINQGENGVWIPSDAGGDAALINGTLEALGDRTSGVYTLHGVAANMVPDGARFGTYANGTEIKVTILFRVDPVAGVLRCVFYNQTSLVWEVVEGSAVIENTLILRCDTTHFTDFAVAEEIIGGGVVAETGSESASNSSVVPGILISVMVVMLICGLIVMWAEGKAWTAADLANKNTFNKNKQRQPTPDEAAAFLLSPNNGRGRK